MPAPAAAAEVLLVVERYDRVSAFPHAIHERIPPVADACTDRPNPHLLLELPVLGREPCRHRFCIVQDRDRDPHPASLQRSGYELLTTHTLQLRNIRSLFHLSVANQSGQCEAKAPEL